MSVLLEKKRIFLVNNFIQDNCRFIFITNYRMVILAQPRL